MSIKHLDKIVSLCKRKGFVFPNSEIYGGLKASYDYGPLGVELKKAISEKWWKAMTNNSNIVGLDSSIMVHPDVWEASGHIANFNDPMTDNKDTKKRYRIDDLLSQQKGKVIDALCEIVSIENKNDSDTLDKISHTLLQESNKYSNALESAEVIDPFSGNIGKWTQATQFNLMFQTNSGPSEKSGKSIYLRPETAQGIYINYLLVQNSMRLKVPFGIAQIGKAFRNEINPRNYTFRSREFEQMELEYFIKPNTDNEMHEYWVSERLNWYEKIGIHSENLHLDQHKEDALAHYASACTDIMYEFPFGIQELEGIAARGNYDLKQHQNESGKKLDYLDEQTNEKYIPHVIEPSAGVDRIALALLCEAYKEEWIPKNGGDVLIADKDAKRPPEGYESRVVLSFASCIAPYKAAILPLVKNKEEIVNKAKEIFKHLSMRWKCFYDQNGAIGRRYRRQDEIGTPFCITIDFETIEEDDCVTVRERDSMNQIRISICELESFLFNNIEC